VHAFCFIDVFHQHYNRSRYFIPRESISKPFYIGLLLWRSRAYQWDHSQGHEDGDGAGEEAERDMEEI